MVRQREREREIHMEQINCVSIQNSSLLELYWVCARVRRKNNYILHDNEEQEMDLNVDVYDLHAIRE